MRSIRRRLAVGASAVLVGSVLLALPASSVPRDNGRPLEAQLATRISQQVALLVTVDPRAVVVEKRQRVTTPSNESEADPLLGGFFIGDYIEVFAHEGTAWVHYNANYRQIRLLGGGRPVNQQDNFLVRRSL